MLTPHSSELSLKWLRIFKIEINISTWKFLGENDYFTIKSGIHVVVHNRGELPLFKNEGVDVQSGAATNIAISKSKYSKYTPPYSKCRSDVSTILSTDSEVYKKTLGISKYRQKLCYEICLQVLFIIPECKCADPCNIILFFHFIKLT